MRYNITPRSGEFVITIEGREIIRVATREEADKLMAAFFDEDRPSVIKFMKTNH